MVSDAEGISEICVKCVSRFTHHYYRGQVNGSGLRRKSRREEGEEKLQNKTISFAFCTHDELRIVRLIDWSL